MSFSDPDIEHLPFFAITTAFLDSLYSSYYKKIFPFDAAARFFVAFQHRLFYVVLSLGRFNLYANSYGFLARKATQPKKAKGAHWTLALELASLVLFWCWFGALLWGCGSWGSALRYLLVSHIAASPVHLQVPIPSLCST
jgi:delta8-fatty-acid desaturase